MKKSSQISQLTETDRARIRAAAALELRNREMQGFRGFVNKVNPRYVWYRHNEVLADVLERVASGELKRVMVFMPPRHGKSEECSRLFSSYMLKKQPSWWIGLCSYGADLALSISMDARENYLKAECKIHDDASAKREWRTEHGGGMWAAGVGGSITGHGYHVGIIDDPFKNNEEAYSDTIRKDRTLWYESTFWTRQEPNAAIIIILTRWHDEDLAGYLLKKEATSPEHWHIVNFPAIKEKAGSDVVFPPTCTVEPDWREAGEALCPERYDEKFLLAAKASVGTQFWLSMYQQSPRALEGTIWKRKWFKTFNIEDFKSGKLVLSDIGNDWDLAYTKDEENSACAFVRAGKRTYTVKIDEKNSKLVTDIYILDMDFDWLEFPQMVSWMARQAGPHYVEAKASGKSAVQVLKDNQIAAREVKVQGGTDKIGRAILATPPAESGNVFIAVHLIERFLDDPRQGVVHFGPGCAYDDVNDAFVQAINRLWKRNALGFGIIGG